MNFSDLGNAVAKQFQTMTATDLFRVAVEKDRLWETYLGSFPEGSNPVHKTRTQHDCTCCRHFIRTLGDVVTIVNGQMVTLWDIRIGGAYQVVADAMAALVKSCTIDNIFLHTESTVGQANSRQLLEDRSIQTWSHFFVHLPAAAVLRGDSVGEKLSGARGTKDVLMRGLREISWDAINTVTELIAQNSLYRGAEHLASVQGFSKLKAAFDKLKTDQQQDLFCWATRNGAGLPVTRIKNTVIGSLLVDLSQGVSLEDAVKMFESKVAPSNYKRPTALITQAMIAKAQAQIEELGLATALDRRYAVLEDITINNVLFADRRAKKAMNVFDELAAAVPFNNKRLDFDDLAATPPNKKKLNKVAEINIEDFLANVLPKAESLEVLFENQHAGNLVSLIAPADPTSKLLFKWKNNFSWSYNGDVTDSIKERVKRAGGNVTGDLCCRLAWNYSDDLDFYMTEPGGSHIFYRNRRELSECGGMLDLDANGADGPREDPTENIYYADRRRMKNGVYTLSVNNYARRSDGSGFEVEIEFDGQIHHIAFDRPLSAGRTIDVARIRYNNGVFTIEESLPSTQASRTIWNVPTQTFRKVDVLMLSPNYWDSQAVGNKHYFFMLDGCRNEATARGFYNEFLTQDLAQHRKVFEVVGAKMKTDNSERQLSGLGFSSTQRNSLLCRVKGSFTRVVKITF